MSGGGGGGSSTDDWRPPRGEDGGGDDKCAIVERTVLNSPVQSVVSRLSEGSILLIRLETTPRLRVIAVDEATGEAAGAITSPRLVDFIECLQNDYAYEAIVRSVSGGRVEIEIRPA